MFTYVAVISPFDSSVALASFERLLCNSLRQQRQSSFFFFDLGSDLVIYGTKGFHFIPDLPALKWIQCWYYQIHDIIYLFHTWFFFSFFNMFALFVGVLFYIFSRAEDPWLFCREMLSMWPIFVLTYGLWSMPWVA